ncbi:hypothetical protein ACFWXA_29700 [Streptomyces atroolivaceus]|uniref:hypothetical protein n=1 Tax=Streptomyces atroolivaceus TaxID=66869 RepID=UPI00364C3FDA
MTYQVRSRRPSLSGTKKALTLNQDLGGFQSSRSVSCHIPTASSHSPAAIASNASVRTARSSCARACAYKAGHRACAPGAQAVTSASPVSATTRRASSLHTRPDRCTSRRTTV